MLVDSPPVAADQTDADLVRRLQQGDRHALAELARRWDGPLVRLAYRVLGDLVEAEDVRQTVYVKLIASCESLADPQAFGAWIRRCAVNEAISAARRRRRRHAMPAVLARSSRAESVKGPAATVEARDEAARLHEALKKLDPDDRALLALRFDEDLTFTEIAAALDRPTSTLKSRYQRAIVRLRQALEENVGVR